MKKITFLSRVERLPMPTLSAMLGAATLSNIFNAMGFSAILHATMITAIFVVLAYIFKLVAYPNTCFKEYKNNTVLCSFYAAFTMILMALGSYYAIYLPIFGKTIWFSALILHILHISIFTYLNVFKNRVKETFTPSWFVTYNGIMVSCVVGDVMNETALLTVIVYYGIVIYFILLFFMLWRLYTLPIKAEQFHFLAIMLAPCSLCTFSYINVIPEPNLIVVGTLYFCVLISLIFVTIKLPKFFSHQFSPTFAAMTFPMAIGCAASLKVSEFLNDLGYIKAGEIVNQIAGFQIYMATTVIGFVLINFYMKLVKTQKVSLEK